jgi:hypothetical protein
MLYFTAAITVGDFIISFDTFLCMQRENRDDLLPTYYFIDGELALGDGETQSRSLELGTFRTSALSRGLFCFWIMVPCPF